MKVQPNTALFLSIAFAAACYASLPRERLSWGLFAYAVGAPVAFLYLYLPFKIHRTQRTNLRPTYVPFDPAGPESPPEVSRYYGEIEGDLARLGFGLVRSYSLANMVVNAKGFTTLFRNPKTFEVIRLNAAVAESGIVRNVTILLYISTEFADGTEVGTSNNGKPRVYPLRPEPYHLFTFPGIRAADHLLAVHRVLVRRFESGRIRVDPVRDDPDGYLIDGERRGLDHHVACGYSYRDEAEGIQRPT